MVFVLSKRYGYSGRLLDILSSRDIDIGDRIQVRKKNIVVEGLLMPIETGLGSENTIILRLDNGYKIGVSIDEDTEIILVSKRFESSVAVEYPKRVYQNLPRISLISTGGTIVSKIDYETGAVKPALTFEDIIEWIPEITGVAFIDAKEVMNIFSENIEPKHWEIISKNVYEEIVSGVEGVIVAHGTDMMTYTASALAFAIRNKPVPIVFVGSQRSSDRPSTDSILNFKAAVATALKAPFSESTIVMHGETSDTYALAHRSVKCRKMHTSRRDAFQSINDYPLAIIYPDEFKVKVVNNVIYEYRSRDKDPVLENNFDDKVVLVKSYPGISPEIFDYFVDKGYHGIVIEGSGLGHIAEKTISSIRRAVEEGVVVVMASQCIFGRVNLNVYSTGRLLLEAGVIPASDMLAEVAFVKLSWILGSKTRDLKSVAELFNKNIVGEINSRHVLNHYPRWFY